MEHQGRSLFSRDDFPGGTPGPIAQLLLSHELAHQWFGDAVTPADWSDLWLNESFATYAQWMWLDHIGADHRSSARPNANLEQRQTPTEPTGEPTRRQPVRLRALRRRRRRRSTPCAASSATSAFFTLLQRWVAENNGTSRVSGGLHRPRRGGRRPTLDRVLRRLAVLAVASPTTTPADAQSVPGEGVEQAAPTTCLPRRQRGPSRASAASAPAAARRAMLTPSQRSGSGSHRRSGCSHPRQAARGRCAGR